MKMAKNGITRLVNCTHVNCKRPIKVVQTGKGLFINNFAELAQSHNLKYEKNLQPSHEYMLQFHKV